VPDGKPGHTFGHPDGVEARRWPTKYLTERVDLWVGLHRQCRAAHAPPLPGGLLAWPAPLALVFERLTIETDRRDALAKVRDG
jgi:hypothetical protein